MKTFLTTGILLLVLTGLPSEVAAQKNALLDRNYWKTQPAIQDIRQKIAEGNSPTELNTHHFDATVYAILENNPLETIRFLIAQGNDLNKMTHDARTYLFWAAYTGNTQLMKYLVAEGARTDLTDQHGYTLLMFAAATGQENTEVYDYCIQLGADLATETDRSGRNALLACASAMKSFETLEYFLGKGLDIHSKDTDGNGVFHQAVKTGNEAFVKKLISEYGVDYRENKTTNENAILFASRRFSRSGEETPLSFYLYLESLGLDPAIVSVKGNTVLHNLALRSKNMELFQHFLQKGADPNAVDEEGNNPLILAAANNTQEVIGLLLKATKDVNHSNKEGYTALTQAIRQNSMEVAKFLYEQGSSITFRDGKGYDLGYHLVDAYRPGNLEEFRTKMAFLESHGYHPRDLQKDGSSLLHHAISKNDLDLVKELVTQGVPINQKDASGQTALHLAAMQSQDAAMLHYLVDAGADKSITTEFDESVYDLASQNEILSQNKVNLEFLKSGI